MRSTLAGGGAGGNSQTISIRPPSWCHCMVQGTILNIVKMVPMTSIWLIWLAILRQSTVVLAA
ncbi:MAG: hypothetical protein QF541_06750 [Lentisphaeria bacterium]|nr:hypothetical protein [Lentisphaeria bacterium]